MLKQSAVISKPGFLDMSTKTLTAPTSSDLAQEASMTSTISSAIDTRSSSRTDRLSSKQPRITFGELRGPACAIY